MNFDIIIRMLQDGNTKGAVEELKKLKGTTGEVTKETEKHAGATKEQTAVLKELKREVPGVSLVLHALKHPVILAAAAFGAGIEAIKGWLEKINQASDAARDLENVTGRVSNMAEAQAQLAIANAAYARSLDEIRTNANSASVEINEVTAALLAQQRAAQEIDDAELIARLEQIQAGGGTDAEKIRQTQTAQTAARHRKSERDLKAAERAVDVANATVTNAGITGGQAAAALPGAKSQAEAVALLHKNDADLAAAIATQNEAKMKELEKKKDSFAELIPHNVYEALTDKGKAEHNARIAKRADEIDEEIAALKKETKDAIKVAKNSEVRMAETAAEQAALQKSISENTKIIEEGTRTRAALIRDLELRRATAGAINAALDPAEQSKASRGAAEADEADRAKRARDAKTRINEMVAGNYVPEALPKSLAQNPRASIAELFNQYRLRSGANDLEVLNILTELINRAADTELKLKLIRHQSRARDLSSP